VGGVVEARGGEEAEGLEEGEAEVDEQRLT
jgi:hypothetical protein